MENTLEYKLSLIQRLISDKLTNTTIVMKAIITRKINYWSKAFAQGQPNPIRGIPYGPLNIARNNTWVQSQE